MGHLNIRNVFRDGLHHTEGVSQSLSLSLDDTYMKLNELWGDDYHSIWNVYGEEIGERVQEYFNSLFEE
jgi:hypothetical protein